MPVRAIVAGALGFACGASALLEGFYALSAWGPIALGVLSLLFGLFVAGERLPGKLALTALGALGLMALLAFLSTQWAESADRAIIGADRWMLYAAFLGMALLLLRSDGLARAALAGGGAGVLAVGGYLLAVALAGDGPSLFQSGRLFEPLGYVNSQGLFLVLGFWPLIALAQYARNPAAAGVAAGGAAALASLALLTQARGVAFSLLASLAAVLAFVPGRARRAWLLLTVLGPVLALSGPLLDIYDTSGGTAAVFEAAIRDAARAALLAAAIAGLLWGIAFQAVSQLPPTPVRRAAILALGGLTAAAMLLATVNAPAVSDRAHSEVRAFKNLDRGGGRSRFLSGGGNRYDYWRIALREFADQPAVGVGAGNYSRGYFLQRRTTEDIRQPHSIELQTLAELGVLGAGALGLFLLAVAGGWWRRAAAPRVGPGDRALLVAAGGVFTAWLAHSSVDWSHLVPGATGLALLAVAYLVRRPADTGTTPAAYDAPRRGRGGLAARSVVGVATALAVVAVVRPVLAQHYLAQGKAALPANPVRALQKARVSLAMNDQSVDAYYLRAAAHARLGDSVRARGALVRATQLEPHNFVAWALLGDLTARRGQVRLARAYYARASALNPRDQALRDLRRTPPTPGTGS
jgi:Tfp pilus assembly protein PilF